MDEDTDYEDADWDEENEPEVCMPSTIRFY